MISRSGGNDVAASDTDDNRSALRRRSRLRAWLPRSDLIRLPAIALATWLVIGLAGEGLARLYYPEQQNDRCHIANMAGGSYQPNCHSRIKMFESAWVDNDYNDCGYRSAHSCKTKPANALRVAVMGTSVARGYWLSYNHSVVGRMEHDLSAACDRPVDVQDVALADSIWVAKAAWLPLWHHIADRLGEAMRLRPDAVVLVMSPFDLASYTRLPDAVPPARQPAATEQPRSFRQRITGLLKQVKDTLANDSRLILVARQFAYRDDQRFLANELSRGDTSDYLRTPFTSKWTLRLKVADETIGRMADQARAAGMPFMVVLMPHRTQAMLSVPNADRHHTDPFALGDALQRIASAHHAEFVDVTKVTSHIRKPGDLFFLINGHPDDKGDAVLAGAIDHGLEASASPFSSCKPHG
jgi:hypothetical protein